jgi:hypothetical protein
MKFFPVASASIKIAHMVHLTRIVQVSCFIYVISVMPLVSSLVQSHWRQAETECSLNRSGSTSWYGVCMCMNKRGWTMGRQSLYEDGIKTVLILRDNIRGTNITLSCVITCLHGSARKVFIGNVAF